MPDCAVHRHHHWKTLCFKVPGCNLALATFVDNLLTTGITPEDATAILDDCEAYLKRRWFLEYGADSREVMVCSG